MISNQKTIFTYIDRFGHEWVIFDHFLKDFLELNNNRYYKIKKALYDLEGINSNIIKTDYLGNYESLDITGNFIKKFYGRRFVMDYNFFVTRFFTKETLKPIYNALNIETTDVEDYRPVTEIEKNIYLARNLIEKYVLPQFDIKENRDFNDSSNVINIDMYDNQIRKDISISVKDYLSELSCSLKELALSLVLKANNNINSVSIEDFNKLIDEKINLVNAKISKKIISTIKNFVKTSNELQPLYTDTTDRIVEESGVKYVLKNGQKFPLVTAMPDKSKYFSISDFLIEKGYSLIYSREFGYVVALKLRSQNVPMLKYLKNVNVDPKNGANYYPREIYGVIENIFDNWVRKSKVAVIIDSKRKNQKAV